MPILPRAVHDGPQTHTVLEEVLHAVTHGIGVILAILAMVFLLIKAISFGGAAAVTAVTIYSVCGILLYLASTVYHASFKWSAQPFLETLDHAAIYLKIAGSYTPFALLALDKVTGIVILAVVWSMAAMGIAYKFVAHYVTRLAEIKWLSLTTYIGMGWLGLVIMQKLFTALPLAGFIWLVAGGLCFTVGAAFYAWKSRRFTHTIFHVFVLAGSICHFIAIYQFVLPGKVA